MHGAHLDSLVWFCLCFVVIVSFWDRGKGLVLVSGGPVVFVCLLSWLRMLTRSLLLLMACADLKKSLLA